MSKPSWYLLHLPILVAFPVMQLCKERGAVAVSLSIIWAVDLVECRFSQQVGTIVVLEVWSLGLVLA